MVCRLPFPPLFVWALGIEPHVIAKGIWSRFAWAYEVDRVFCLAQHAEASLSQIALRIRQPSGSLDFEDSPRIDPLHSVTRRRQRYRCDKFFSQALAMLSWVTRWQ